MEYTKNEVIYINQLVATILQEVGNKKFLKPNEKKLLKSMQKLKKKTEQHLEEFE